MSRVIAAASLVVVLCVASMLPAQAAEPPRRGRAPGPPPVAAKPSLLAPAQMGFACDLYGRLREKPGNLFLSPYSISTTLAMTYAGARGETEKQIGLVLHCPAQAETHAAFAEMQAKLNAVQAKKHVQLSVASSLWAQKSYAFLRDFLDLTQTYYGAGVHLVDYRTAAEAARREINAWVEKKTQEKIKDLIKPQMVDAGTRLVLCNAIYFRGDWARQFKKDSTKEAPFKLAPGETVPVPLMNQTGQFGYGEMDALQILELPYAGDDLSMIVLLPKTDDGLPSLDANMTPDNLRAYTAALHPVEVDVFLPKFKMTCGFRLAETLAALGMSDAFDAQKADFSGMTGTKDLFISEVIHKAFVDVNEEGTEAAAATAVVKLATARPMKRPVFRADHPFLFLIRANATGSILFLGRLADPRS